MWNYRVVRRGNTYAIHEITYGDNGEIRFATESPVFPIGESSTELKREIKYYAHAFDLPILNYSELSGHNDDAERSFYRNRPVFTIGDDQYREEKCVRLVTVEPRGQVYKKK
jgi:hypothetical protein